MRYATGRIASSRTDRFVDHDAYRTGAEASYTVGRFVALFLGLCRRFLGWYCTGRAQHGSAGSTSVAVLHLGPPTT